MMPNRNTDPLLQLVHALEKAEKRNFKLYIKRNSGKEDLKVIQLFDALDKLPEYDEKQLLKKQPSIHKPQLANLKAHLYRQLLASLRVLKSTESIDLQLHEQLDHARILYNKGLYHQSLKILEKIKDLARQYHQEAFLIQVISLEKKIETLHITRSLGDPAETLTKEANEVNQQRIMITRLSNLALQLYHWYVKHGHARNEKDEKGVRQFFRNNLPPESASLNGFYEQLYLFQSYCWFAFIRQDFIQYYRYARKWVELFEREPHMIDVETGHYIKGLHNVLTACFDLRNHAEFDRYLDRFLHFSATAAANQHYNFRMQTFVYKSSAQINGCLMRGNFEEGIRLLPGIDKGIAEYSAFIDRHRVLVLHYKIAMLYFGNGNFEKAIDYLRKIINGPVDLRIDLQCYARLLHLLAHYELGNESIIESQIKSVYRFMLKMENLTLVEEAMFDFLRKNFYISSRKIKPALEQLLLRIKKFEKNRFETRAFAYIDIISWIESKVYEKPMSAIIHEKYRKNKHRKD